MSHCFLACTHCPTHVQTALRVDPYFTQSSTEHHPGWGSNFMRRISCNSNVPVGTSSVGKRKLIDYCCNQFSQLLNVSRVFTDIIQWVHVHCFLLILLVDCAQDIVFQELASLNDSWMERSRENCCFTGEVNVSANENGSWFIICGSLEGWDGAKGSLDYFPDGLIVNSNSYWMELEPSLSSLYTTVYGESRSCVTFRNIMFRARPCSSRGNTSWNSGCPPMSMIWRRVKVRISVRNSLIDCQSFALTSEVSAVVTSSRELRVRFLHPCLTTFDNLDNADWVEWLVATGEVVTVDGEVVTVDGEAVGLGWRVAWAELLLEGVGGSAGVPSTRLHSEQHCSSNSWQCHPADRSTTGLLCWVVELNCQRSINPSTGYNLIMWYVHDLLCEMSLCCCFPNTRQTNEEWLEWSNGWTTLLLYMFLHKVPVLCPNMWSWLVTAKNILPANNPRMKFGCWILSYRIKISCRKLY